MSFLGPGPHLPHFVLCVDDRGDGAFFDPRNVLAEGSIKVGVAQLGVFLLDIRQLDVLPVSIRRFVPIARFRR